MPTAPSTEERDGVLFHPCPPDPECRACQANSPAHWSFLEAVYCISLRDREDRMAHVAAELHRTGLCARTVFCRPTRPDRGMVSVAIWKSHQAAARHALARGVNNALILEDDVQFSRAPQAAAKAAEAFSRLPAGWLGYFLGHWPVEGYFVAPGLMKVHSGCAHAYVAARSLLEIIDRSEPPPAGQVCHPIIGRGIDGLFASLDDMYALFPMIATQSNLPSDNLSTRYFKTKTKRPLTDPFRYREIVIIHGMRPAEWICALLSPLHRLRARRKAARTAC